MKQILIEENELVLNCKNEKLLTYDNARHLKFQE